MLFACFRSSKACDLNVAASGVFFTPEDQFVGSKEVWRGPWRPYTMRNIICVILGGHFDVNK